MRFCGQCATVLALRCPRCGFDNPPSMRFCGQCGSALAAQDVRREPQAERRHLSVMFCDLVGSTELSASLDPEDWREILHAYQNAAASAIRRFEGYIAQLLGDGLLIYFGYPRAHEDDAVRAVRAGLALLAAVDELPAKLGRLPARRLAVRIGVHTGHVVISEMGAGDTRERLALGHVPNVASRLQGVAAPATLLISETTYQLVRGFVECESAGTHELKGVPKPVAAYRVLGLRSSASRLDIALAEGATPLAGRLDELEHLQGRWRQARGGAGRAVLVSGEPGIGKSRLVRAFRERLTDDHRPLELVCSALFRDSALHPVVELVSRGTGPLGHRDGHRQRRRLAALVRAVGSRDADAPRWLASLLGLPDLAEDGPPRWTPLEKKRLIFETLLGLVRSLARRRPVLLVVEDLHWVDPSTLELLAALVEGIGSQSVFLLITTRPEGTPGWPAGDIVSRLELRRLSTAEIERMIQGLAGDTAVSGETLARLVERADGVPLFVEELARAALDLQREAGGELAGTPVIPERLQDLLAARLDRLGPAKQLAQVGATIGREFAAPLLADVLGSAREQLTEDLQRLLGSGLVIRREDVAQESFAFRHALIQEAAYNSLLRSERVRCHGQIAEALESGMGSGEVPPELVAHHFTEAGRSEPAISYWLEAGRRAVGRSANIEATRHLQRGLDLVDGLPASGERDQRELELRLTLGPALMAVHGFARREIEALYQRAVTLADGAAPSPRQRFAALWGLVRVYSSQDHLRESSRLGQKLVELAEEANEPDLALEAHRILGSAYFQLGELTRAHHHLEKALALFEAGWTPFESTLYLQPRVFCLFWMGYVKQFLGFPRQADQHCDEALRLAESTGEPFGIGAALAARAVVSCFRRDSEAVLERAEIVTAFARERKLALWGEMGALYRGWAWIQLGRAEEGLTQMQEALAAWRKLGMSLVLPQFLCLTGEGHVLAGRVADGLLLLDEARSLAESSGECVYLAEILRQKGDFLAVADASRATEALSCMARAVQIANQQKSRFFELRALVSLARATTDLDERRRVRARLKELLAALQEAREEQDYREADAVIAGLGPDA